VTGLVDKQIYVPPLALVDPRDHGASDTVKGGEVAGIEGTTISATTVVQEDDMVGRLLQRPVTLYVVAEGVDKP